jgi:hypothetical protein
MHLLRKRQQVFLRAKPCIQFARILDPVPMIRIPICRARTLPILRDRADPYSGKPGVLDVVQVRGDGGPGAATPGLSARVAGGGVDGGAWGKCVAVGNDLVNGAAAPVIG